MIFKIDRASMYGDFTETKPCDEAYKTEITHTNGRGKTVTREVYVVNIGTLEEMMKFVNREGKIVIYPNGNAIPQITIYDDWIE